MRSYRSRESRNDQGDCIGLLRKRTEQYESVASILPYAYVPSLVLIRPRSGSRRIPRQIDSFAIKRATKAINMLGGGHDLFQPRYRLRLTRLDQQSSKDFAAVEHAALPLKHFLPKVQ